jgi:glycosyltransferase involved in cell wall biosynthesis
VKIAYLITWADAVGGASIHVRDLARAMLERGHQATVLLGGHGPVTEQLAAAGVPYLSLQRLERRIHPLRDLLALVEIVTALRVLAPDLVSTHTAKAGWIGRAAARGLSIPVLYTPHGWSIDGRVSLPLGAIFSWAEKAAAKWCAAIICVCEDEKRLALSKGVAAADKLLVVHNGVGDIARELRGRPAQAPVRICLIARFASPKDHRTLLAALAALSSQPWELDLVGAGPLEAEMRDLASELRPGGARPISRLCGGSGARAGERSTVRALIAVGSVSAQCVGSAPCRSAGCRLRGRWDERGRAGRSKRPARSRGKPGAAGGGPQEAARRRPVAAVDGRRGPRDL